MMFVVDPDLSAREVDHTIIDRWRSRNAIRMLCTRVWCIFSLCPRS